MIPGQPKPMIDYDPPADEGMENGYRLEDALDMAEAEMPEGIGGDPVADQIAMAIGNLPPEQLMILDQGISQEAAAILLQIFPPLGEALMAFGQPSEGQMAAGIAQADMGMMQPGMPQQGPPLAQPMAPPQQQRGGALNRVRAV